MSVTPTPVTAALAGAFSGLTWPLLWSHFAGTDASSTVGIMLATIVLVALPAHGLVLGFNRPAVGRAAVDSALLVRIGTWLACAALAALLLGAVRGPG